MYRIYREDSSHGQGRYSKCRYYVRDYAQVVADLPTDPSVLVRAPPPGTPTAACDSWHYETDVYTNTIVSEVKDFNSKLC